MDSLLSELNPYVFEYDDLLNGPLKNFLNLSASIGGTVQNIAEMAEAVIRTQRQFLVVASKSRQPDPNSLSNLLRPTSEQIQAIQVFREKNRATDAFNHLSAVSESIGALGWVAVSPTPGPYVKEMRDSSQFYTNKVLVAYKDKNKTHVEWAKAWIEFLTELQNYIKKYHTTGLSWNPRGGDASSANGAPAPPPRGGPGLPPPPPPPPADFFLSDCSKGASGGDGARLQLLKDLSMGTDITKSLRRVTSEQQTHKNPALKVQGVVPAGAMPSRTSNNGTGSREAPAKPPKFELEGKKWMVEYQIARKDFVIQETEMNQSVNLYKCRDCLVQIKGKVNSVTIDSCSKTAVVFDDIVSVVEFINCQNVQAQVTTRTTPARLCGSSF